MRRSFSPASASAACRLTPLLLGITTSLVVLLNYLLPQKALGLLMALVV